MDIEAALVVVESCNDVEVVFAVVTVVSVVSNTALCVVVVVANFAAIVSMLSGYIAESTSTDIFIWVLV